VGFDGFEADRGVCQRVAAAAVRGGFDGLAAPAGGLTDL